MTTSFLTACGLALDSIKAHKLRSFLTLLGVVIGVASVILVGAGIEGLGMTAEESTSKAFGTESYLLAQIANVGRMTPKQRSEKLRRNRQLRRDDLAYLRASTGEAVQYSPYFQRVDDVKQQDRTMEACSIIGVSAALAEIRDVAVVDGRFFTEQEEHNKAFVAVIGDEIRTTFFPGTSPLGETIRVRGYDFKIVGVQEKLGSSFGRSQDNSVYIPDTTYEKLYGPARSMTIFARSKPGTGLSFDDSLEVTRGAMRIRNHLGPTKEDNFDFLTPDSIRGFVDSILGMIRLVVVPITLISLIVGGIVIMNIMLVSVTERTKEIGIRKSLGARSGDIMALILTESFMISAFGGLLGILIAWGLVQLLVQLLQANMRITWPYVALAVFVSSGVGLISGWYPARKASRLDPIEALRAD
ncbi:ABC transporter permease [Bryobacter aggregatus]|uniref:ABC transporter permease n=1 Tax=Bryobacter aggregatus TaxID=360054 RepID=UPI0004E166C1|nr:ABC transporter permease [Bryobacter aggregatus]